jgi:hypothetical protein
VTEPTGSSAEEIASSRVFYTALGVLGVGLHHPFGLELGIFENTFHLTAGPLTLLVGVLAPLRRPAAAPAG